jgi:hypothetical protein
VHTDVTRVVFLATQVRSARNDCVPAGESRAVASDDDERVDVLARRRQRREGPVGRDAHPALRADRLPVGRHYPDLVSGFGPEPGRAPEDLDRTGEVQQLTVIERHHDDRSGLRWHLPIIGPCGLGSNVNFLMIPANRRRGPVLPPPH